MGGLWRGARSSLESGLNQYKSGLKVFRGRGQYGLLGFCAYIYRPFTLYFYPLGRCKAGVHPARVPINRINHIIALIA